MAPAKVILAVRRISFVRGPVVTINLPNPMNSIVYIVGAVVIVVVILKVLGLF